MAGASDEQVVQHAACDEWVILTFDLEYPTLLALRRGIRPSAVIFRTANASPERIHMLLGQFLEKLVPDLAGGAIAVIEDERIRVRRFADLA
jgi:predicted nuclease of predicted toxin-antitoxin system